MSSSDQLVRVKKGRMIAGVCAGIARWRGSSPTGVRLLFVASIVLPGPQVLFYLGAWAFMKKEDPA